MKITFQSIPWNYHKIFYVWTITILILEIFKCNPSYEKLNLDASCISGTNERRQSCEKDFILNKEPLPSKLRLDLRQETSFQVDLAGSWQCTASRNWKIVNIKNRSKNSMHTVITFYSHIALARDQRRDLSGLRVKLPPVYHTRWRLHVLPLIAKRKAGKLWIPISLVFGLTWLGIKPASLPFQ